MRWLTLVVIMASSIVVFHPSEVNAAVDYGISPTELPARTNVPNNGSIVDPHQYINLTDSENFDDERGAYLPVTQLKIYDTSSRSQKFYMQIIDRRASPKISCQGYKINVRVLELNGVEGPTGRSTQKEFRVRSCANLSPEARAQLQNNGNEAPSEFNNYQTYANGNYYFSFDSGWLNRSSVQGHENLYTGLLLVRIVPDNFAANNTTTFHINTSTGRLGFSGYPGNGASSNEAQNGPVTIYPSLSGSSSGGGSPPPHVISQMFGVPCGANGGSDINNMEVYWVDDDTVNGRAASVPPQDRYNMSIRVYEFGKNGFFLRDFAPNIVRWSGSNSWGSTSKGLLRFNAKPGYKYRVDFQNVQGGNGIGLYYPFDSSDFNLKCPSTTPVSTPGCDAFRHTMKVSTRYKFTFFYNNGVASTGGPPDGRNVASGNNWTWKTFNQPVAHTEQRDGNGTNVYEFNYPIPARDYVIYIERWVKQANNSWTYYGGTDSSPVGDSGRFVEGNCYNATCEIFVPGNVPLGGANEVKAGEEFDVVARIRNNGRAPLNAEFKDTGYELSATLALDGKWNAPNGDSSGNLAPTRIGEDIPSGQFREAYFTLNAPNDRDSHIITMYPDYWGLQGLGPACPATVSTFQPYKFDASVDTSYDDPENPVDVTLRSTITKAGVVDVDSEVTRNFYRKRAGSFGSIPGYNGSVLPNPQTRAFMNFTFDDVYTVVGPNVRDDSYCVYIKLERGEGWRGPGDLYRNARATEKHNCAPDLPCPPGDTTCTTPPVVEDRPYLRNYGADVAVGGGFEGVNCSRNNAGIKTFTNPIARQIPATAPVSDERKNKSGSGAQLATLALGDITGFTSASIREESPFLPNGLTFANNPPGSVDANNSRAFMGGRMSGDGWCAPNYFDSTQFLDGDPSKSTSTSNSINIASGSVGTNKQTVITPPSRVTLTNTGAQYNKRHTVYVDGDVYIENDIKYTTSWASVSEIPNFTLVVRGNIYISHNVSQLDGLYIAQPKNGAGGNIYTCSIGGTAPVSSVMFANCGASEEGRQLTVNGSFIAQRIVLNRTGFSLRHSTYKEKFDTSRASEIFNFSPELYLSPPVFKSKSSPTSGTYQSITTLAPIL